MCIVNCYMYSCVDRLCLMEADAADNESDWNSNKGNINKTKHGFYCYPK